MSPDLTHGLGAEGAALRSGADGRRPVCAYGAPGRRAWGRTSRMASGT